MRHGNAQDGKARRLPPNRIGLLRKRAALTQKDLAERLGCTPATVMRLEQGQRQLRQHWMERIAMALGVRPADLLPDADAGSPGTVDSETLTAVDELGEIASQLRRLADHCADAGPSAPARLDVLAHLLLTANNLALAARTLLLERAAATAPRGAAP